MLAELHKPKETSGAVMAAAVMVVGCLLYTNGVSATAAPVEAPVQTGSATTPTPEPVSAEPSPPLVEEVPVPAPPKLTVEQVRAALQEAEKRRLEQLKPDPGQPKDLVEKWGVEIIGINSTAAGYMLDFRFRVLDAAKALPLFDHRIKPYVIADRSQIKLPVPIAPKVGSFRPTNRGKNIKANKTYYIVFGNPDSHVKTGETVSVVIGDFRAEHLTVQ